MKTRTAVIVCSLFIMMLLTASCASLKLSYSWKDETYRAEKIKKVLIIAFSQRENIRDAFEDDFARRIRALGVEALPSHTVLPFEKIADRDVIIEEVKDIGADVVLTTRLIDRRIAERGGTGKTQYDYYGRSFGYVEPPPYIARGETSVLRTNLFDTKTAKLVWSGEVETGKASADQELIASYVTIIMDRLVADRMLK